jgi:transcriptional regulator with XRE-family HTH domain
MNASVQPSAEEPASHRLLAGLTAGLVLRAARLSAGLTQPALAAALQVSENTICSWEDGTEPLACIQVDTVDALKKFLIAANADPELAADIDPATWCDVILMAMDNGEDTSCLLADPLTTEPGFAQLFNWATTGQTPSRYSSYYSAETSFPGRPVPGPRQP